MKKLCVLLAAATLTLSGIAFAEDAAPANNMTTPVATDTSSNVQQVSQPATKREMRRQKNHAKKRCGCGQG